MKLVLETRNEDDVFYAARTSFFVMRLRSSESTAAALVNRNVVLGVTMI